jgi:hypothetical protein
MSTFHIKVDWKSSKPVTKPSQQSDIQNGFQGLNNGLDKIPHL